jgi:hypothetical protein
MLLDRGRLMVRATAATLYTTCAVVATANHSQVASVKLAVLSIRAFLMYLKTSNDITVGVSFRTRPDQNVAMTTR